MELDLYVDKDGKKLRCGYTTGSCAAAAAKAAALVLKTGKEVNSVYIDTPAGIVLQLPVEQCRFTAEDGKPAAFAAVKKDAGDDPDSTDGIPIYARVSAGSKGRVEIDGGEGIGRITKKGLFGRVGEAAINPVPRRMIQDEVLKILPEGAEVLIFSPEGREVAKKTFNRNIGIEGGISIIGTTGIVYPMSEDAIKKTIYMEIDGVAENGGTEALLLVPGNYGERLAERLSLTAPSVKVSNYIGDSLSYAYSKGFKNITLLGHIGKFSKLSIGIFNTHNRTADTRMEAFVYYLALHGSSSDILTRVNGLLTAEECFNYLIENGMQCIVFDMERGAEARIKKYLKDETVCIRVLIYSMKHGPVSEYGDF